MMDAIIKNTTLGKSISLHCSHFGYFMFSAKRFLCVLTENPCPHVSCFLPAFALTAPQTGFLAVIWYKYVIRKTTKLPSSASLHDVTSIVRNLPHNSFYIYGQLEFFRLRFIKTAGVVIFLSFSFFFYKKQNMKTVSVGWTELLIHIKSLFFFCCCARSLCGCSCRI